MDNCDSTIKNKNKIILYLIIIIGILLIIFYWFDKENITVKKYLTNIYKNKYLLNKKFNSLINSNYSITKTNNIIIINNLLDSNFLSYLQNKFINKQFKSKNAYFRKGSGYDFNDLHKYKEYNSLLDLFYNNKLLDIISDVVGKPIQRPPLSDVNACSLLIYTNNGDFIDWHKDYSNYYGDRYVILLTLINENASKDGLSQNEFYYIYNGKEYKTKFQPNTAVIFKGSEVLHKSTSIGKNERRIIFSMTVCDICQEKKNIINYIYEKIKNMVIYN